MYQLKEVSNTAFKSGEFWAWDGEGGIGGGERELKDGYESVAYEDRGFDTYNVPGEGSAHYRIQIW